jgi:hypothetical protein
MRILADELKRMPIDESEFILGTDYTNCVIQFPHAMDSYILLQHTYPGIQFCFVRRDPNDIVASMKRIKWLKDDVLDWEAFLVRYVQSRYLLWETIKEHIPEFCGEIDYSMLENHPFFVHDREGFTTKQWQADKPVGPKYWANNTQCINQLYGQQQHYTGSITERLQAISPGIVATTRPT